MFLLLRFGILLGWTVLLLLSDLNVHAQQPRALVYNHQNGLPSNTVFSLLQDRDGYFWLTTNEGLYRYDGMQYVHYTSPEQTSFSGSNLLEDIYGRIWYESFDGFLYYVENNRLKALVQQPPVGYSTFQLTDRHLFVIQKKGIDVYDLKSLRRIKTFAFAVHEAEHSAVLGQAFYCIIDHRMYKIDENLRMTQTNYFSGKSLKVKYLYPVDKRLYVVSKLNEEQKGYFFDANLNFISDFELPQIPYIQGSNVIDQTLWIHTSNGSYAYTRDGKAKRTTPYFPANSASKVVKDFQQHYWFASVNNGLFKVPQLTDYWYPIPDFLPTKLTKNANGYLIGTSEGSLWQYDKQFKPVNYLRRISENLPTNFIWIDPIAKTTVVTDNGFTLYPSNDFTHGKQFNIALKDIVRVDDSYYAFAASGFYGLLRNPNAPAHAVSKWDRLFKAHQHPNHPEIAQLKKGMRVKSIAYDAKQNELLIATNTGLYVQNSTRVIESKQKNGRALFGNRVVVYEDSHFALDTKGNLYTRDTNGKWISAHTSLDFEQGSVKFIKPFGANLVILTSNALFIYGMQTKKLQQVAIDVHANQIRDVVLEAERLQVLRDDGVVSVLWNRELVPKKGRFKLHKLYANAQPISPENWNRLSYDQHHIEIGFSLVDFSEKPKRLAYRMNQNEWITLEPETRKLQFPSLSPGEYELAFKLDDDIQSETITFTISAAFWQKWWFYLLVASAVSSLIFVYFRWQSRLMKNQIRLLNEKVELEKNLGKSMMASIKSQMNPHFFYNALNTIQAYIYTNDKEKANTYLAKFSKLTRRILEMSEKETISLTEELDALQLYLSLENMRFNSSIQYSIDASSIDQQDSIELPPMLIQPFVENAIKHGLLHQTGEKRLHVQFELIPDFLKITIDDNGIGRERANQLNQIKQHKSNSFASEANEKRLAILNKVAKNKTTIGLQIIDKYSENNQATGTTVVIQIPI